MGLDMGVSLADTYLTIIDAEVLVKISPHRKN